MSRRERETNRRKRGAHADSTFADASFGQAHDVEARQTLAESHFDLHGMGFDADEAGGVRCGQPAPRKSTSRAIDSSPGVVDLRRLW